MFFKCRRTGGASTAPRSQFSSVKDEDENCTICLPARRTFCWSVWPHFILNAAKCAHLLHARFSALMALMWGSVGFDVGLRGLRCGALLALMWASQGFDVRLCCLWCQETSEGQKASGSWCITGLCVVSRSWTLVSSMSCCLSTYSDVPLTTSCLLQSTCVVLPSCPAEVGSDVLMNPGCGSSGLPLSPDVLV